MKSDGDADQVRHDARRRTIKGEFWPCYICDDELSEPYVKCADCSPNEVRLCLNCFCKGREIDAHQNDHSYEIMRNDFEFTHTSWKAADELKLLMAIDDSGFGNWSEVAKETGKSATECEYHYLHHYIDFPAFPLPKLSKNVDVVDASVAFTYAVKDDPPRPAFDTQLHLDMAGYSAARGDFITEHNNYAEMDLRDVEFLENEDADDNGQNFDVEDRYLDHEFKFALLDIYVNHLRERARRKKIICKYGLVHIPRSTLSWLRYDAVTSGAKSGAAAAAPLRSFVRLVTADDFNKFLESLQHQSELEQRIKWLQEFRESGVTSFAGAAVYQKLKSRRDEERCTQPLSQTALCDVLNLLESSHENVSQRHVNLTVTPCNNVGAVENHGARAVGSSRKMAPPLDIIGLPGYDKLNSKEKEICSQVRFVPDAYLEFKAMLLNECNRNNGTLRLAQARQLIKIDVNKTRKLYDFLVQEGFIKNN